MYVPATRKTSSKLKMQLFDCLWTIPKHSEIVQVTIIPILFEVIIVWSNQNSMLKEFHVMNKDIFSDTLLIILNKKFINSVKLWLNSDLNSKIFFLK